MERDFETILIEQCAPTLAGLKPANLFNFEMRDHAEFAATVEKWRGELSKKGVSIRVLKDCARTNRHLVYVYREQQLQEILHREDAMAYLQAAGYQTAVKHDEVIGQFLTQLSQRICCEKEFPHEIGIFLGYPLEDVIGFVENKGKNFTCCGYWKTYGDPAAAQKLFARYRKCTEVYLRCYQSGIPITRLAVAV